MVNARVAGLLTTDPLVLNCEPWHGQMNVVPDTLVMVQPSCVQRAVSAENASCERRATRQFATGVCTSAVPPTDASGEPVPTTTLIVRPDTVPATVFNAEPLPAPLGEVELPPHPGSMDPTVTAVMARHAWEQNSRRFTRSSVVVAVVVSSVPVGTRGATTDLALQQVSHFRPGIFRVKRASVGTVSPDSYVMCLARPFRESSWAETRRRPWARRGGRPVRRQTSSVGSETNR